MQKIIVKLLILISISFLVQAKIKAQTNETIFFYYKGQKLYRTVSYDRIVAEIKTGYSYPKLKSDIGKLMSVDNDSILETEGNKQLLLKLGGIDKSKRSAAFISKLQTVPGVLFTRPVFKTYSGKYASYGKEFVIKLKQSTSFSQLQGLIDKTGCTLIEKNPFREYVYILAAGEKAGYDGLAMGNLFYETGLFDYAEPNKICYNVILSPPNDLYYDLQWAHNNIGQYNGTPGADMKIQQAWDISMGESYIKMGVIDGGVDLAHPDLYTNILQGFNGATMTTYPGAGAPIDNVRAHGTNCAGIIAAIANNGIGIAGVAPNCKIIPATIFDVDGFSFGDIPVARAIDYVRISGASVISNSWALEFSSDIDDAINTAVTLGRYGKGCMVLCSSGNDNTNAIDFPANKTNVISVGGVNMCNQRKSPESYPCDQDYWNLDHLGGANYGEGLDVVAPCVKIATTDIQGSKGYNKEEGTAGDYNYTFNGTSAACPYAAGVAALILSVDTTLTVSHATQILELSCSKVGAYKYSVSGDPYQPNGTWNDEMGHGSVNAYTALRFASFKVTSPNNRQNYEQKSRQAIKWSPGYTNVPPILYNVKISLSTDGGLTFPIILENSTPNDGIDSVTIPEVSTTTARIKVETLENIFFDVSDSNFSISKPQMAFWLKADSHIYHLGDPPIPNDPGGVQLDEGGAGVIGWYDEISNDIEFSSALVGWKPRFVQDAIGGKPAIYFFSTGSPNGEYVGLRSSRNPFDPNSARTIMVVGKMECNANPPNPELPYSSVGGSLITLDESHSSSLQIAQMYGNTYVFSEDHSSVGIEKYDQGGVTIPNEKFNIAKAPFLATYTLTGGNGELSFRLNKANITTTALGPILADPEFEASKYMDIGYRDGRQNWKGWISEVIAFHGVLSAHDRDSVENYLVQKYSLDLNANANPPTIPTITATKNTICAGQSTTLNITSGILNTATHWEWYHDNCGGDFYVNDAGRGNSITVSPDSTTTYFARGEGVGCVKGECSQGLTITVIQPDTTSGTAPTITASKDSVCVGDAITLSITAGTLNSGAVWKWYNVGCSQGLLGEGTSIMVTPYQPNENWSFHSSYFARAEGPGCTVGFCSQLEIFAKGQYAYSVDADGDRYPAGPPLILCTPTPPPGYVDNATMIGFSDCDDNNASIHGTSPFYVDADGDGYGHGVIQYVCLVNGASPPGYSINGGDCDDTNPYVHSSVSWFLDADGDHYSVNTVPIFQCISPGVGYTIFGILGGGDCDDSNPLIHSINWYLDKDGDHYYTGSPVTQCTSPGTGYTSSGIIGEGDCNDNDPVVHNMAWYLDADGDHYYTGSPVYLCSSPGAGYTTSGLLGGGDLNDNSNTVYPGAKEDCNNVDDDCNGIIDDNAPTFTVYRDADGDLYVDPTKPLELHCIQGSYAIPSGYAIMGGIDCDDTNVNIHPNAEELCGNGIDDNCNGQIDEGIQAYLYDGDGDGLGGYNKPTLLLSCSQTPPSNYVLPHGPDFIDCNDDDKNILGPKVYYADSDGDGYGDPNNTAFFCDGNAGYVSNNSDCDDTNPNIHPGATEIAGNGIDDDCDGLVDILIKTCLWTGGISGNWSNPANWDCQTIPDQYTDVIINGGTFYDAHVDINAVCRSLQVSGNAFFDVNAGFTLDIKKGKVVVGR